MSLAVGWRRGKERREGEADFSRKARNKEGEEKVEGARNEAAKDATMAAILGCGRLYLFIMNHRG